MCIWGLQQSIKNLPDLWQDVSVMKHQLQTNYDHQLLSRWTVAH